jgi:HSP20 family protein
MLGYWDPFAEINAVQDRLFGRQLANPERGFRPAVDIYEDEDAVHIDVELAGVKPEDIKVDVENDVLTIHGSRNRTTDSKKDGVHRVERAYGTFSRAFVLGKDVDSGEVGASYEGGLLKLTLRKRPTAKRREIAVKAA